MGITVVTADFNYLVFGGLVKDESGKKTIVCNVVFRADLSATVIGGASSESKAGQTINATS